MRTLHLRTSFLIGLLIALLLPNMHCDAAVTGDIQSDPIILNENTTKNTFISKDGNIKYFKLIVKEPGTATIKLTSKKLKKDATITLFYDDNEVYREETFAKYHKKSKSTAGTLTTSQLLQPGQYNIRVSTARLSKKAAFTLAISFKTFHCEDIEPNNSEANAQPIIVANSKHVKKYQMLLSGEPNSLDMIDQFKFTLRKSQRVKISATANGTDRIRILLKKKTDDASETINSDSKNQYFISKKGKNTFTYTTDQPLSKGTYFIMVWLDDSQNIQVPYTIKVEQVK